MTITITKKKAVAPETNAITEKSIPPEIVQLIEEVGLLQDDAEATTKRIKELQAHVKPYAEKVKQLAALVSKYAAESGFDPDVEFAETTDDFILQVGKAGTLRTVVDAERAMKRMGKKLFFEKCTIGLGILDAYLAPAEKEGILKVERCERSIRVLRRIQGQGDA
jgi:hypothetical protein